MFIWRETPGLPFTVLIDRHGQGGVVQLMAELRQLAVVRTPDLDVVDGEVSHLLNLLRRREAILGRQPLGGDDGVLVGGAHRHIVAPGQTQAGRVQRVLDGCGDFLARRVAADPDDLPG